MVQTGLDPPKIQHADTTHRIQAWNIYLHYDYVYSKFKPNVGKYSIDGAFEY